MNIDWSNPPRIVFYTIMFFFFMITRFAFEIGMFTAKYADPTWTGFEIPLFNLKFEIGGDNILTAEEKAQLDSFEDF